MLITTNNFVNDFENNKLFKNINFLTVNQLQHVDPMDYVSL